MKQFNWEEFKDKNNKIAVHCKTEEEAKDFCKQMHEHGMKWLNRLSYINNTCYGTYKMDTCYTGCGTYSDCDLYKEKDYTILEWSDYMKKEFTKSDLKDGMVIECRNKWRGCIFGKQAVGINNCLDIGCNHNRDLKSNYDNAYDIVKIYIVKSGAYEIDSIFEDENLGLIWERNEKKYMTSEEMRQKLEELTGEKIEVEPSREEMIGTIEIYCDNHNCYYERCCIQKECAKKEVSFVKCDKETIKKCYEKVMEDGRKES